MKKIIFPLIALVTIFVLISNERTIKKSELDENLIRIEEEFKYSFYHSLFSVEELRPYAILQSPKTLELYAEDWISSDQYLDALNNKDLDKLKEEILVYLSSIEEEKALKIINKLEKWCIVNLQFEVFEKYGLKDDAILNALYKNDITHEIFNKHINSGPFVLSTIPASKKNEIINDAMNLIAEQPTKDQLYFHSSLYRNFAISY